MPQNHPITIEMPEMWEESRLANGTPYWRHMDTQEKTIFDPRLGPLPPSWTEIHASNQIFVRQNLSGVRVTYWDPRIVSRHRNRYVFRTISAWRELVREEQADLLGAVVEDINEFIPSLNALVQERDAMTTADARCESDANLLRAIEAIATWLAVAVRELPKRKSAIANTLASMSGSNEQISRINGLLADIDNLEHILADVGEETRDEMRDHGETTERYRKLLEKLGPRSEELSRVLA